MTHWGLFLWVLWGHCLELSYQRCVHAFVWLLISLHLTFCMLPPAGHIRSGTFGMDWLTLESPLCGVDWSVPSLFAAVHPHFQSRRHPDVMAVDLSHVYASITGQFQLLVVCSWYITALMLEVHFRWFFGDQDISVFWLCSSINAQLILL